MDNVIYLSLKFSADPVTLLINKYIIIHNNETCSNSQYSAEKKQEEEEEEGEGGGYMVQLLTHSDTYLCQPMIQTLCASIFTDPVHSSPTAAGTVK